MRVSTLIGSGRPLFNIPDFRAFASAGAPTIGIEMATTKENLIAARALIDRPEKWGKGNYRSSGCRCVVGALADGSDVDPIDVEWGLAYMALFDAIPERFGKADYLHSFNDHPDTTHADMMALFDRAIAAQDVAP